MTYSHTVTLITTEVELANRIARAFDPDTGGLLTFKVGCSADGNEPITHYITQTAARQEFVDLITGVRNGTLSLKTLVDNAYSTRWPDEIAPTQEECDSFWSEMVIEVDKSWRDVLDQNNLSLIEI